MYGDEALARTLATISDLWYDEPHAATGPLVIGMSRFLGQYGDRLEKTHLDKLRKTTPMRVVDAARVRGKGSLAIGVAAEMRQRSGVNGRPALVAA